MLVLMWLLLRQVDVVARLCVAVFCGLGFRGLTGAVVVRVFWAVFRPDVLRVCRYPPLSGAVAVDGWSIMGCLGYLRGELFSSSMLDVLLFNCLLGKTNAPNVECKGGPYSFDSLGILEGQFDLTHEQGQLVSGLLHTIHCLSYVVLPT